MRRPRSLLRPVVLLALVGLAGWTGAARGQDQPLGPTPDEQERLRLCPELRDATGRRREQLEALYFELSPRDLDADEAARVRALFDLTKPDDAALVERELGADTRCLPGLQAVLRAHGARGLTWLLEHLAAAAPAARGRMVAVLGAFGDREAWQVLVALLDDRTPVPNRRAAAEAPPGYQHLRVCDHALRALGPRLADHPPPEGVEWKVDPLLPMPVRDKRVAALKALATTGPLKDEIARAPAARDTLADDPAAQQRLDAAVAALVR
jgi:hypothetical protein